MADVSHGPAAPPSADELAAVPLFRSLSRPDLAAVAQRFVVRDYPAGTVLATEGDRLEHFSVILAGRIQWYWTDESGRQLLLQPEGPGGHFADATLGGEPILMSIAALEPLRVAEIGQDELRTLLLQYPAVGHALLLDVVARLRRLLRATRSLSMEEVYPRVVNALAAHAVDRGGRQVAPLTQRELGQRVGATREMVGRILRDLARGGYIQMERGCIVLLRTLPRRW